MSLTKKLLLVTTVLMIAGLVITDVITYYALSSFYTNKVLNDLDVTENQLYPFLYGSYLRGHPITLFDQTRLENEINPNVFVSVINPKGLSLLTVPVGSDPPPKIPAKLPISRFPPRQFLRNADRSQLQHKAETIQVPAIGKPHIQYLLEAVAVPQGTLVVAEDLAPQQAALSHLLTIEIVATIVISLLFVSLSFFIINKGLKPLKNMADTAIEISQGNFEKRVEITSPNSEVGQLGLALNVMLAQLTNALNEKVKSEKRLRNFIADASHELRTPLTSIKGYAELAKRAATSMGEPEKTAILRINDEADRLGEIVDELLLLARLDSGRKLDAREVNLTSLVTEMVGDFSLAFTGYEVSLEVEQNIFIQGDEFRLRQVVGNLLKNIHDHVPSPAKVDVTLKFDEPYAKLSLKDNGKGIEQEEQERVFERFYRGAAAPKGGSGLGLPIVKAIVEAHNGTIVLNSKVNSGTEYIITLPGAYKKVKTYEVSSR